MDHKQKIIEFQVTKCDNDSSIRLEGDPACALDSGINEYIKGIEVLMKVINKQIDFSKYKEEPTFTLENFLGSVQLDPGLMTTETLNLQYHEVITEDTFL